MQRQTRKRLQTIGLAMVVSLILRMLGLPFWALMSGICALALADHVAQHLRKRRLAALTERIETDGSL